MQNLINYYLLLVMLLLTSMTTLAQDNNADLEIKKLEESKEKIVNEEKRLLSKEVRKINEQLEDNEISFAEAEKLKARAAKFRALNIENRLAIVNHRLSLLKRNAIRENDEFIANQSSVSSSRKGVSLRSRQNYNDHRRTFRSTVIAFGFNNVITENESFNDSDFRVGGSRFFEIGYAWTTRVFKNSNWLRFKYGLSFQFNSLKPTGNRFFVDTGTETELQEHEFKLKKSKLRMDNLVIPIHFEFGGSRKFGDENNIRYSTFNKVQIGIGGYAGINLNTIQKLKIRQDGSTDKKKFKRNFNTNNVIYGLSTYIKWKEVAIYAKYDLNTIFKDNPVDQRNVSVGLLLNIYDHSN